MLYRTKSLGVPKGTRRFRLGRRRESTRQPSESILQTAWMLRSPIGSHIPVSTLQVEVLGVEKKNLPCCTRNSHLHPCRSRITVFVSLSWKRVQRRHVMIRSNRYVGVNCKTNVPDVRSVCPLLLPLLPCRGGFGSLSPFSVDKIDAESNR
jgi:hypothetical protein